MSSRPYDSNEITREYFDSLLIETRYIDSVLPSMKTSFLGYEFDTPIMTAALSHLHNVCENGMREHALAAKKANAACFVGMGEDEELEDMLSSGAHIIKSPTALGTSPDMSTAPIINTSDGNDSTNSS